MSPTADWSFAAPSSFAGPTEDKSEDKVRAGVRGMGGRNVGISEGGALGYIESGSSVFLRVHPWLLTRGASQERDAICVRAALRGHPKWPPQIWQVARMRGKGLMPGVDGQRDSGIRRSFPAGRPALPGKRRRIPVGEPRRLAGGNAPHAKEAGVNGSLQERLEREVTAGQRRAGEG